MTDDRNPGSQLLELRSDREGDTHTLHLAGELDIASAPELRRELEWIALADPKNVVLDIRELTFIDSEGISVLLSPGAGLSVQVVGARGQVRSVLDYTGVSERLNLVD